MNRGYTVEEYLEFLGRARAFLHQPEIGRPLTLAGDIIVGFPSETEEDFAATVALLEKARYKNCFIFKYSPRPGTIAYDKLADDVAEETKRLRNNELLAVQNRVSAAVSAEFLGQTLDVFVQGVSRREVKKREAAAAKPANGAVALTLGGKSLVAGASCSDEASYIHDDAAAVAVAATTTPDIPPTVQLTGRTEGDIIVLFDAPAGTSADALIGRVLPVRIDRAEPLALHGRVA